MKVNFTVVDASQYYEPRRATKGAIGYDLSTSKDCFFAPYALQKVPTNIKVEVPQGYMLSVILRSSVGAKGLSIPHGFGLIDWDYRGEILVPLKNLSEEWLVLKKSERFAQCILVPVVDIEWEYVDKLTETERDIGGFGSTNN